MPETKTNTTNENGPIHETMNGFVSRIDAFLEKEKEVSAAREALTEGFKTAGIPLNKLDSIIREQFAVDSAKLTAFFEEMCDKKNIGALGKVPDEKLGSFLKFYVDNRRTRNVTK